MATATTQQKPPPRSWLEIDLAALRANAQTAARLAAPARLLPIIKSDAYGHGAIAVARTLQPLADAFAVADLSEALQLRHAGITGPILLLTPSLPEERPLVLAHGFIPTVSSLEEARDFLAAAQPHSPPPRLHFKIDTGMGRLGAWKHDALAALRTLATEAPGAVAMISTHLSAADENLTFTLDQLTWFAAHEPELRQLHPTARLHALNSAGLLRFPQYAFDLVRPGLMLYGISPVSELRHTLRPVMAWRAKILLVRDLPAGRRISYGGDFVTPRPTRLAVIAAGYADGYFRQIRSGTAHVLIHGTPCPVVGRVTMDMILADATDAPPVQPGHHATLLGRDGPSEIRAEDLARWAGTIPWHVLTTAGRHTSEVLLHPAPPAA